ncbi:D-aminoacyl-tRNA deacylase [Acidiplasma sp.]|uniref:D-aminoacyl-tRNA deacylase n=1 Tax=Acidiplasma sp. TaxID=1872114 RepID=UPI002584A1C3|nr:D-aminoacyl-tRNA deacylase [Acidiplasma sp.]
MILIIASEQDGASTAMAKKLLEIFPFERTGESEYKYGDYTLMFIKELHIYSNLTIHDNVSTVIFLSKHSSSAGVKSLTVHPIGNFREAALGGKSNIIVMSDPEYMSASLRYIKNNYNDNHFEVTFEATHHGPYLEKPSFFIEIGTTESEWSRENIQEIMVSSIINPEIKKYKNFVGVGGGHYAPKISEYFFENDINIGHIIPKYVHDTVSLEEIENAVIKTPLCSGFLMDSHGTKARVKSMIEDVADRYSLEIIRD